MTTTSGMKCIGTGSFTQIHGSQLEDIPDGLTLFVALTPNQFLCSDQPVVPDPYSGRFGLRAVDRCSTCPRVYELASRRTRSRQRRTGTSEEIRCMYLEDHTFGVLCTHGAGYPREGRWIEPLQRWLFSMEWAALQRENRHP